MTATGLEIDSDGVEGGHLGQGVRGGGDTGEFEGSQSSGGGVGVEQLLFAFLLQPVQHLRAVPLHLVLVDSPLQHSKGVVLKCLQL